MPELLTSAERGRLIAHYLWDELEKIAQAPGSAGEQQTQAGSLEEGVQQGTQSEGETSPAHGVVAARVEQLDTKRARGIPQIQPPPGYVYNPELGAFVPNMEDPGWMSQQEAMEAARNKGWYDQGQADMQTGQAQAEMDQAVDQQHQQAVTEQQQQQAATEQQQAIAANAQRKAVEHAAKEQAKAEMAAPAVPPQDVPAAPQSQPAPAQQQAPKRKSKKRAERGVTIKIGK